MRHAGYMYPLEHVYRTVELPYPPLEAIRLLTKYYRNVGTLVHT